MPIKFSHDKATIERHFDVYDKDENILTPVDPQFSVSDETLVTIQSHTDHNAVLAHTGPHTSGIVVLSYSVPKGDSRITINEEIEVVFGEPDHIVGSSVE